VNGKSYLISGAITLGIVAWMGSGYLMHSSRGSVPERPASEPARPVMTVQVSERQAEAVTRQLESQGQAEPNRQVTVRAETTGRVTEILATKGARVEAGDALVRIAMKDRQARLEQAKAAVAQREADYDAVKRLGNKGYQAATRVREAYAALQSARADLKSIREDIDNTVVRAPFAGVLNDRMVDVGDYLSPGDPVADVVDNNPLKVVVHIAQQDIAQVPEGAAAEVELATGQSLKGNVTFIAAAADSQTRTFRVEISLDNAGQLPAGVSATVRIPLDTVKAHFLSPALLALDESGQLGAKTVKEDGRVAFYPVEVVRTEMNGVWVTGLPNTVNLITVGQGFVRAGETVKTVSASQADMDTGMDRPPRPDTVTDAAAG
jgi:multidrug efflux system membrane fusion protein